MNDWNAKHYKKHAVSQESAALNIISEILFRGDECILDIGCGSGNITKGLAEKVPNGNVIGIDPSSEMIQQATDDYLKTPNLSFQLNNAENFKFDKKFDLITSFFALLWVKDQGDFMKIS